MAKPDNDEIASTDVAELGSVLDGLPETDAPVTDTGEAPEPEPEPARDSVYYSPTTRGFYHDLVHGSAMPADVIEIGHDAHGALMEAQGAGKMIVPGEGGVPVAVDRPGPTLEQRIAQAARFRDGILRDTAWRIADDEPERDTWHAYRAKVRAIDLAAPDWPDAPA